jgi:G3E family GTPase
MSVPVIALTGRLGAGKTSLLNHLLAARGARIGVVVNDFGAINVDAALVAGQVDQAASITGGCLCCLPDSGGLDEALETLTAPRLRLDAVVVEASGVAHPLEVYRRIRFSSAENARPGGVVEVVDLTAPTEDGADGRFDAATLVVANKSDLLPPWRRSAAGAELADRVRERNPSAYVVAANGGNVDPGLVLDVADPDARADELPLADLVRGEAGPVHAHARSVSVPASDAIEAGALVDLLENPPPGAYRLKGIVPVRTPRGVRRYVANVVGRHVHIADAPRLPGRAGPGEVPVERMAHHVARHPDGLVAIGTDLEERAADERLHAALRPAPDPVRASGLRRLDRHRRLSR